MKEQAIAFKQLINPFQILTKYIHILFKKNKNPTKSNSIPATYSKA
jgi:hypothetical protein